MDQSTIKARRDKLESDMRAEGTPEWLIERNATLETAARMVAYERQVVGMIANLFGGSR